MKPDTKKTAAKKSPKTKTAAQATAIKSLVVKAENPDLAATQAAIKATEMAAQASLLKVKDEASAQTATEMLLQLKAAKADLQATRDELIRPLKEVTKKLELKFKPISEQLFNADQMLRNKVLTYRQLEAQRQELHRAELSKAADEAASEGEQEEALELATKAVSLVGPSRVMRSEGMDGVRAQVTSRKVLQFEVEDLGEVPMEFFSLDDVKVRSAIRSGVRSIKGLRIFEVEQLAVGGI